MSPESATPESTTPESTTPGSVPGSAPATTPTTRAAAIPNLLEKLVQATLKLHPFQALEFDPETGTLVISSENLVPERSPDILQQIVLARRADEELSVKRFPNGYKVVMTRKIQL